MLHFCMRRIIHRPTKGPYP